MRESRTTGGGTRLVRAFRPARGAGDAGPLDPNAWPATVPAAAQLLREGLELPPGITILVGENGSGKSTVVEVMAEAYGLNPQGGSILTPRARVRESEPASGHRLFVEREPGNQGAWAYFLRADTMHILELGEWGMRPGRWADLGIVASWRDFLNEPELYLRYLLSGEE